MDDIGMDDKLIEQLFTGPDKHALACAIPRWNGAKTACHTAAPTRSLHLHMAWVMIVKPHKALTHVLYSSPLFSENMLRKHWVVHQRRRPQKVLNGDDAKTRRDNGPSDLGGCPL